MSRKSKQRKNTNSHMVRKDTASSGNKGDAVSFPTNVRNSLHKLSLKQEMYQGPLPSPTMLADYDKVVPGCAEKIIDQFVLQGKHRMKLEERVINSNIMRSNLGLGAGFIIVMSCLIGSFYSTWHGFALTGISGIVVSLGSLAAIFLYVNFEQKKELKEKDKLLQKRDSGR